MAQIGKTVRIYTAPEPIPVPVVQPVPQREPVPVRVPAKKAGER